MPLDKENTMTRKELVNIVAESAEISKATSKLALEAMITAISDTLALGEKVTIRGLGTFQVVQRAARKGVNPKTLEPLEIPARQAVKFKPSSTLKEELNK